MTARSIRRDGSARSDSVVCVRVHAPAKINLSLRLLGTRPDGYHDVRTVLQSVALHDTLTLVATTGPLNIHCDDPRCPTDASNLVWRAAQGVWRAAGRRGVPSGVRVTLDKRVPIQAGLGGGSSDAAAALRGLAAFWRLTIEPDRLATLAGALGTDVPFFLEGGTALGLDRGETLFPLMDRPSSRVVIVIPDFGVSTPDAYRWWDERRPDLHTRGTNDLEAPVAARHPEIARIVRRLGWFGAASASMSGSGSAVFGLFEDEQAARAAGRGLAAANRRVIVTRTIDRRRYATLTRPRSVGRERPR